MASDRARARLVDVARVAGVSAQTVSNVLNGRVGFTDDTRLRVLEAVRETGYRPNRAAQHLRTRRARQIGFHLTGGQLDIRNPFSLALLKSLIVAAEAHEHRVTVSTHAAPSPEEFREDVLAGEVDGYVLNDCDLGDYRVEILSELGVPFVAMGRTLPARPQTWVDVDNRSAMFEIVDHLVERGHRRFAYVGYGDDRYWTVERMVAVRERLAWHGLRLPDGRVARGAPADIKRLCRDVMGGRGRRPTAVVTGSDSIGIVAVNVAYSLGLQAGVDVAITGFDGCALESLVDPSLTTAQVPVNEVAEALVTRLMRESEYPSGDPGQVLTARLLVGGSA